LVPACGNNAQTSPGQQGSVRVQTSVRQPVRKEPPLILFISVVVSTLPFLFLNILDDRFVHQKRTKTFEVKKKYIHESFSKGKCPLNDCLVFFKWLIFNAIAQKRNFAYGNDLAIISGAAAGIVVASGSAASGQPTITAQYFFLGIFTQRYTYMN
jgi:hypothetical protein